MAIDLYTRRLDSQRGRGGGAGLAASARPILSGTIGGGSGSRPLGAIVESSKDAIIGKSLDGIITSWNAGAERIYGYRAAEAVGKPIAMLIPPGRWDELPRFIEQIKRGEVVEHYETERIRKNGEHLQISLTLSPVKDAAGAIVGISAIGRDITESKRAEAALRRSREEFKDLFDNAPIGFHEIDAEGRLVRINNTERKMLGYSAEELLGQFVWKFSAEEETSRRAALAKLGGEEPPPQGFERVFRRKDGTLFPVLITDRLLKREDGVIIGIRAAIQDITGRKRAEEKLQHTMADLERSNKELEQFAYVASHDLQEPLRMVSSYTQLLAKRFEGQLDDKTKKYIHYVVDGAIRMQTLINDLLTYSRVGTRGQPLETADSHATLGEAIRNLSALIEENRAIITNDNLPTVRADAAQLVLLFQNLLANAIKFRREDIPSIHVSAQDRGREWVFAVRDNGIGIEPQHAERVFVLFSACTPGRSIPAPALAWRCASALWNATAAKSGSRPGRGKARRFSLRRRNKI